MSKTTTEKLAQAQSERQQIEAEIKRLTQQHKEEERKARTKRLIERGAIKESLIENPADLTNEQFKALITEAMNLYKKQSQTRKPVSVPVEKPYTPEAATNAG